LAELGVELIDLVFNVEVNFDCGAVLGYLLTVELHFYLRHSRPLQASNRFCSFCHRVFRSLGKALFGCSDYVNNFLRHRGSPFDFAFSLWIVPLVCAVPPHPRQCAVPVVPVAKRI